MPYKVYLADDSITIQKVVELTLSEEDFEVTAFGDGESALDAARKAAPDIILADIVMPRLDGYQLCAAVKQAPGPEKYPGAASRRDLREFRSRPGRYVLGGRSYYKTLRVFRTCK